MQRRSIILIIAAVICLLGGWGVWHWLGRDAAPDRADTSVVASAADSAAAASPSTIATRATAATIPPSVSQDDPARYRLSNTVLPLDQLVARNTAILLENANVDTSEPLALAIPDHLRAADEPGAYIVQSRGPVTIAFHEQLRTAGVTEVGYMPHNAWLVSGTAAQAQSLVARPGIQAVLPFEPYYKLKSSLLPLAVNREPLPPGTRLNLVLFAEALPDTMKALSEQGADVLGRASSPFGPVVTVQPAADGLVALARLPGIQLIERATRRVLANDLARVTMGVSLDTIVGDNHFGLTGTNVLLALVDSGVDITHPDLTGRVITNTTLAGSDTVGHGTFLAGIIAGSGADSANIAAVPSGSVEGADFRGKAPGAKLFSMRLGELPTANVDQDGYYQEQAALTNAFISNNSWFNEGNRDYDIFAASYDAATRDALPTQTGPQPLLFVFAAGNSGGGNAGGQSGIPGTVLSPSTAKNVISVGALEQSRNITNEAVINGVTNALWAGSTDSSDQVAAFSSRGNVGIGVEGIYGRFKPDVVAPGSFVLSAQSAQWNQDAYYSITNSTSTTFANQIVLPGLLSQYSVTASEQFNGDVRDTPIAIRITVTPDNLSSNAVTNIPIYLRVGDQPTAALYDFVGTNQINIPPDLPLTVGETYYYAVGNPTNDPFGFTLSTRITYTNNLAGYQQARRELNDSFGDRYRYDSGTSMSAAGVSGVLALMQEYYQDRMGKTNSPALMKALVINGARAASSLYDLQVQTAVNSQGWGLVRLPTSLPSTTNSVATNGNGAFTFYDQDPDGALATGQSRTREVVLGSSGAGRILRCTLVWTDPAGNPAAGIKLVNDLDLVVTNKDTGEVYVGNNFPSGSGFTEVSPTNATVTPDLVNNVENVFIPDVTNGTYSVTVIGRRVNVNAVTAHTNNVVQDYALVITCGDGEVTDAFTVSELAVAQGPANNLTVITNTSASALPLLNQSVGASSPLIQALYGVTNQWHFYIATNYGTNANFTNAAFVTFQPPTLSVPRMGPRATFASDISRPEADIDLYVSTLPGLTNLDAAVLNDPANTWRSVGRGGTEIVTLTNAVQGQAYYIGIKSEDQMAGQYGLISIFSDRLFSERDAEGNQIIYGTPVPGVIPDGDNTDPGAVLVFGIAVLPDRVRSVSVTNTITHDNMGDLLGNLSHNSDFVVLNNHSFGGSFLTETFVYDDTGGIGSRQPDGPGSLEDFVTGEAVGLWLLAMVDNSPTSTGQVETLTIKVQPQNPEDGDDLFVPPFGWAYTFVDVPPEATNLTIIVTNISANPLPVGLYVRRNVRPTLTQFDHSATITPPGGSLSINKADNPPLEAGIYYIGIYNPNPEGQDVNVKSIVETDINGISPLVFQSTNAVPIFDDAVTNTFLTVTNDQRIARLEVGLRVNHPRVSDLAFQLVSPIGTRVLLFENRGGADTNGLGADIVVTNAVFTNLLVGSSTNEVRQSSGPLPTNGVILLSYEFAGTNTLTVLDGAAHVFGPTSYFDVTNSESFTYSNLTSGTLEFVVNDGGGDDTSAAWTLSAYTVEPDSFLHATFTEDTNKVSNPQSLLKFVTPPFIVPNPSNVVANLYSNGIYYLPEESLDALKGENAKGTWTLEMWDSRVGATNPGPELVSWNLSLILEQVKLPFIVLEPFVTLTSTVPAGEFEYLVVDVPSWATAATNWLLSATSNVFVWFNQDGLPTGVAPPDTLFFGGEVTNGVETLTTTGPLLLVPGQRYFLGIQNTNAVPVTYTYRVDFDITALTNQVPYAAVTSSNNVSRYFSYVVSTNAVAVLFELFGLDGDVNLVASQGRLPTREDNDYFSFNTGTNDEAILVFTNSSPVALQPGTWYLGVLNGVSGVINYTIQATELTNALPNFITLTNGIPYANNSASLPGTAQYYRYQVTTNANRAQFEIFGATGDFTLVASKGLPLPGLTNWDYRSANPGTNDELIVVITNSTPVNLTAGDWFITVVKISGGPADYSVMATEWPVTGLPVQLISSGVNGTDFCLTWASLPGVHYYVEGKTSLVATNWITISPTITAIDTVTSWCIPLPTPYSVFRVVEGVVVSPASPVPTVITGMVVTPGQVVLSWYGPVNSSYQVEWTDSLSPVNWQPAGPPITSAYGNFTYVDDGTDTGSPPGGGSRYYRIIQLP